MKKMTIENAAKLFGVSKEAIHNRIRRNSLQAVIEDGIKYVLIPAESKTKSTRSHNSSIQTHFHSYLEKTNEELKAKIEKLEDEMRKLRKEKEELLIEERKRIEQIYKEKDEQLKNILNAISSKFLLEAKPLDNEEHLEAEIEESHSSISLKKYLKQNGYSAKKREKILSKAKKLSKKDPRFERKKEKIFINPSKYDYSDLF